MGLSVPWGSQPWEACELLRPSSAHWPHSWHPDAQTLWTGDPTPHHGPSESLTSLWEARHHMANMDEAGLALRR